MIQQMNYTGRKPLDGCFAAYLLEGAGERPVWDVYIALDAEAIAALKLAGEYECRVEVYRNSRQEAFTLGQGKLGEAFKDRFTTSFSTDVFPLLRIKLIAKGDPNHRILASKDRFSPPSIDQQGRRQSLLPIRYENLGVVPRKLRDVAEARPVLVVNSNLHRAVGTAEDLVKRDRLFTALVLPEAYRQILSVRLLRSEIDKEDNWLKFTGKLIDLKDLTDETSEYDRRQYLDEAVKAFCELHDILAIDNETEVAE